MKAERQKIFDPEETEKLRNLCDGKDAHVMSCESVEKKMKPPRLYDLTTLQREANRIYGFTGAADSYSCPRAFMKKN